MRPAPSRRCASTSSAWRPWAVSRCCSGIRTPPPSNSSPAGGRATSRRSTTSPAAAHGSPRPPRSRRGGASARHGSRSRGSRPNTAASPLRAPRATVTVIELSAGSGWPPPHVEIPVTSQLALLLLLISPSSRETLDSLGNAPPSMVARLSQECVRKEYTRITTPDSARYPVHVGRIDAQGLGGFRKRGSAPRPPDPLPWPYV